MAESDYLTLTEAEAAFLKAAVDTIIPADELSPSGSECGVVDFIDCELAGPYGEGARLYRDGPVVKGKPEQGYQLDLTPREFFRQGIAAADAWTQARFGAAFAALDDAQRQAAVTEIDSGTAKFENFEAGAFFEALLQIVIEGFFADPYYGGNRDMAGWKMIGYPGLPADYQHAMEHARGKKHQLKPRSIGDFA
ncbi:MAG TPA: gluconate 2-dehydrogenase subunit 3 family protein [Stellaceae bacterium]|jgi:gluconate 2-dehydrogenase gamma chain|nr:gluconate 2-dehydrogenase subunit 3 family protein [Stellaceae bacterium]